MSVLVGYAAGVFSTRYVIHSMDWERVRLIYHLSVSVVVCVVILLYLFYLSNGSFLSRAECAGSGLQLI